MTPELEDHLTVLENWRSCHSYALLKAYMGLRSRCQTCKVPEFQVSQRLKRQPTIADKLTRIPKLELDRMQDIAGVRAVVPNIRHARAVERRWTKEPERVLRTTDYVTSPKDSGYRAIHVIATYDGALSTVGQVLALPVEVQIRTEIQHMWADDVENLAGRTGVDFKSGKGPPEVLKYLALAAEAMAYEEDSKGVPDQLIQQIRQIRDGAIASLHPL